MQVKTRYILVIKSEPNIMHVLGTKDARTSFIYKALVGTYVPTLDQVEQVKEEVGLIETGKHETIKCFEAACPQMDVAETALQPFATMLPNVSSGQLHNDPGERWHPEIKSALILKARHGLMALLLGDLP